MSFRMPSEKDRHRKNVSSKAKKDERVNGLVSNHTQAFSELARSNEG